MLRFPQTGDATRLAVWALAVVIALLAALGWFGLGAERHLAIARERLWVGDLVAARAALESVHWPEAAGRKAAGLAIKINMVALKGLNEDEIAPMLRWCGDEGFDLTLIETMPLGEVEADRTDQYLSLTRLREELESFWTLEDLPLSTGGPASHAAR